jgi:uncharacterized protein YfdQ (DUF2303 family)
MTTPFIEPFAEYVKVHAEGGASIFVNPDEMTATAVLNLGMPSAPGHADNTAKLAPQKTAAYAALRTITAAPKSQIELAEFMEDWAEALQFFNGDDHITPPKAIAAVRKITIEALRKQETAEQQLSATRSAFESVQATSAEPLPTTVYFTCAPYADLQERTFVMRLGILTGDSKPRLTLRIQRWEQHLEEMADELGQKIRAAFDGEQGLPVLTGSYSKGK